MALMYHQFPIAHLLISSYQDESSSSGVHLKLAVIEGDADAVDFLLDVPVLEAKNLLATASSSPSSSSSLVSPSSSASALLNALLACTSTDEIRIRILTTLRRAGLALDISMVSSTAIISDDLRLLISQPLSEFVAARTRRVFEAITMGSLNVFEQWLACGVDVASLVTADGSTLLHACVSKDAHKLLELVLSTCGGISNVVNLKSSSGVTALHLASQFNRVLCVQLLLSHSADINEPTDESNDCNTPLVVAAAHCSHDAFTALLAARADVSTVNRIRLNVLHVAAAAGNTFALQAVLSAVSTNQAKLMSLVTAASSYGDTPLHMCSFISGSPPLKALKCALLLLQVNSSLMPPFSLCI
jgi:hypothetical protein